MIRKHSCETATRWPPPGAIVGTSLSLPSAVLSAIAACQCVRQARLVASGMIDNVYARKAEDCWPMCEAGLVVVVFDAELWLWDARRSDSWTFVS